MYKKAIIFIFLLATVALTGAARAQDKALWERYKENFVTRDGRTIDFYQSQVSHSEGQGYAMLIAVAYDDRETFDRVWAWTKDNLLVRSDNLFAWQWGKRPNGAWEVMDYNNATDGDSLIAYALIKASRKWGAPEYNAQAIKVVKNIRKSLVVSWKGKSFLLPSYYGFVRDNGVVLNPSYIIFPALRSFAEVDDKAFWDKLYRDGMYLVNDACFGKLCLPADWVMLTSDNVTVHTERSTYYGNEAIRTILHLSSVKSNQFPQGVAKMLEFYRQTGYFPFWVDLSKDSFSFTPSPAGYYAIYGLAADRMGNTALGKKIFKEAKDKLAVEGNNYYSYSLYLLATSDELL